MCATSLTRCDKDQDCIDMQVHHPSVKHAFGPIEGLNEHNLQHTLDMMRKPAGELAKMSVQDKGCDWIDFMLVWCHAALASWLQLTQVAAHPWFSFQ